MVKSTHESKIASPERQAKLKASMAEIARRKKVLLLRNKDIKERLKEINDKLNPDTAKDEEKDVEVAEEIVPDEEPVVPTKKLDEPQVVGDKVVIASDGLPGMEPKTTETPPDDKEVVADAGIEEILVTADKDGKPIFKPLKQEGSEIEPVVPPTEVKDSVEESLAQVEQAKEQRKIEIENLIAKNMVRKTAYGEDIKLFGMSGIGAAPVLVSKKSEDPEFSRYEIKVDEILGVNGDMAASRTFGREFNKGHKEYVNYYFFPKETIQNGVQYGIEISGVTALRSNREVFIKSVVKNKNVTEVQAIIMYNFIKSKHENDLSEAKSPKKEGENNPSENLELKALEKKKFELLTEIFASEGGTIQLEMDIKLYMGMKGVEGRSYTDEQYDEKIVKSQKEIEVLNEKIGNYILEYRKLEAEEGILRNKLGMEQIPAQPFSWENKKQEQISTIETPINFEEYKDFYNTAPDNGSFNGNYMEGKPRQGASMFGFKKIDENNMEFVVLQNPDAQKIAKNSPNQSIEPTCKELTIPDYSKPIITKKPGKVMRIVDGTGTRWKIVEKAEIVYGEEESSSKDNRKEDVSTQEETGENLPEARELKGDFFGPPLREDGSIPQGAVNSSFSQSINVVRFEKDPNNNDQILGQLINTPEIFRRAKDSPNTYILSMYQPTANSVLPENAKKMVVLKHAKFRKEGSNWVISEKGIVRLE